MAKFNEVTGEREDPEDATSVVAEPAKAETTEPAKAESTEPAKAETEPSKAKKDK